jgi:4,5-dihydroxyphthalate decarboxylase
MAGSGAVRLRIAVADYGHTAALKTGRVAIRGVAPDFVPVRPIVAAYRRMVRDLEFDVCEIAAGTYMIAREAGVPFTALPVFTYRRFHHGGFVCRADAGIRTPRDLEGRKAGVRAWSVSTGIWTRGILQNEYSVDLSKITWVVDDEEHVQSLRLPPYVIQAPPGCSLAGMMAAGEIQAAFTDNAGIGRAGPPQDDWKAGALPGAGYTPLFPDAPQLEADWFRRTGIYPVHGLIAVKDALLEQHPWLSQSLFEAFHESRAVYLEQLEAGHQVSEQDDYYRRMAAIVGDPLPYGVDANRPAITAMIRYCRQQGLLRGSPAPEDLFVSAGVH